MNSLIRSLREKLFESEHSVLVQGQNLNILLSGPNLFMLALKQSKIFRKESSKIIARTCDHQQHLINFLGCLIAEKIYLPLPTKQDIDLIDDLDDETLDGCLILLTSGSTGKRKVVLFKADQILIQLTEHHKYLENLRFTSRVQLLPHFHSFGFILNGLLALYSKQDLYIYPHRTFNPSLFKKYIEKVGESLVCATPRHLEVLAEWSKKNKSYFPVYWHVGGALLNIKTRIKVASSSLGLVEGYGLTECGPGVLMNGKPLVGEISLRDVDGSEYKELIIKTPTLGNILNSSDTKEDSTISTKDLVRVDSDGCIQVVGRIDNQVKFKNALFYPIEILEEYINEVFPDDRVFLNSTKAEVHIYFPESLNLRKLKDCVSKKCDLDFNFIEYPIGTEFSDFKNISSSKVLSHKDIAV